MIKLVSSFEMMMVWGKDSQDMLKIRQWAKKVMMVMTMMYSISLNCFQKLWWRRHLENFQRMSKTSLWGNMIRKFRIICQYGWDWSLRKRPIINEKRMKSNKVSTVCTLNAKWYDFRSDYLRYKESMLLQLGKKKNIKTCSDLYLLLI